MRLCIPQAVHAYWRRAGHGGLSRIHSPPFTLPTDEEGEGIYPKTSCGHVDADTERRTGLGAQGFQNALAILRVAGSEAMSKPRVDALTFRKGLCVPERMPSCLPYRCASTFQTLPVHARGVSPFAGGFAQVASPFACAPA